MKQALSYFEGNEYDLAFKRMKQLVEQERTVESLHNLAWLYVYEKEDLDNGQTLAEEAVSLEPNHPFPYALLAEIYLKKDDLSHVESLLNKVLETKRMPSVIHNLGVLYAEELKWKEAAECFQEVAKPSSYLQMMEIYCRIKAGDHNKAEELLLQWDESQDDFIGWSEAADLWIELGEFNIASEGFEKEWGTTISSPYIVDRYSYVLHRLGNDERLLAILKQTISNIEQELNEEPMDDDWTEEEKHERIQQLEEWKERVVGLPVKLELGFVPPYEFDVFIDGGCYLFGCVQHNHGFYDEGV